MYDKISVTPVEYDKGHGVNKHGSKIIIVVVVVGLKPGSIPLHSNCHDHDTKTKRL